MNKKRIPEYKINLQKKFREPTTQASSPQNRFRKNDELKRRRSLSPLKNTIVSQYA
jgi:hypothetical protein